MIRKAWARLTRSPRNCPLCGDPVTWCRCYG